VNGKKRGGNYVTGHIYLPREPAAEIAYKICHELGHAHSRHSLSVRGLEKKGDIQTLLVSTRHEGFSFTPDRDEENVPPQFNGFNEGVVELFAKDARRYLVRNNPEQFTDREKKRLIDGCSYPLHVALVICCLKEVQQHDELTPKAVWRALIDDLLEGKYQFIKRLDTIHRGATKIIASMGPENEDVQKAAVALGGTYARLAKLRVVTETM
jgi:hypothetical protein